VKSRGRHLRELRNLRAEYVEALDNWGWIPGLGWFLRDAVKFFDEEIARFSRRRE
jgi:signal transduction histidine kinase